MIGELVGNGDKGGIPVSTLLTVTGETTSGMIATNPLMETFARLAEANPYLTVRTGVPTEGTWASLGDLLDLSTGRFEAQWAATGKWYSTDIPEVITRFLGGGIVYAVAGAAVGAFARDRRVPDLSPDNVCLGFADWGSPNAVAFSSDRFVCLPDDPAALLPHAETVPTIEDLRALLRERLIETFTPFVSLLRSRAKIGARALWQGAAENCAHAILACVPMRGRDDESWLHDEVTALICQTDSPLRAKADLETIEANGHCRMFLIGSTCCENFKREGEGYCNNCPHRKREERIQSLRDWFTSQHV